MGACAAGCAAFWSFFCSLGAALGTASCRGHTSGVQHLLTRAGPGRPCRAEGKLTRVKGAAWSLSSR